MTKINSQVTGSLVENVFEMLFDGQRVELSSEQVKQLICEMSAQKIRGRITLDFNEHGQIHPEVTIKGESALKMFLGRKI